MSSCRMAGFDTDTQRDVVGSFGYALGQISDRTTRSLVVSEFVHALNRRGKVRNSDVDDCIDYFMD